MVAALSHRILEWFSLQPRITDIHFLKYDRVPTLWHAMGTQGWLSHGPCSEAAANTPNGKSDMSASNHRRQVMWLIKVSCEILLVGIVLFPLWRNHHSKQHRTSQFQYFCDSVIQTSVCSSGHSARSLTDYPMLFISILGSPLSNLKWEPGAWDQNFLERLL